MGPGCLWAVILAQHCLLAVAHLLDLAEALLVLISPVRGVEAVGRHAHGALEEAVPDVLAWSL